jgi:prepilin-type N-terminal cleavage/methylation domain-containing protein
MTRFGSGGTKRRNTRGKRSLDQAGFTLIETLVGVMIIAMVLSGMAVGLRTLNESSTGANLSARLDAMLSASGQVLKALPYEDCADEDTYESAFLAREAPRPESQSILKQSSSLVPKLSVDSVNGGPSCDAEDAGYQRVKFTVAFHDKANEVISSRQAEVVKFDPARALSVPYAEIDDPPQLETASGSAFATYSFTANGSSSEEGLAEFRWHCGSEPEGGPDLPIQFGPPEDPGLVFSSDDSEVRCTFPASTTGENVFEVSLEITDNQGQIATAMLEVRVAIQSVALPLPIAVATITSGGAGVFPLTTQFSSAGSGVPGGTISYHWDFGDGKGTASLSTEPNPSHLYEGPGPFTATLTVTDQYEQTSQKSVKVNVTSDLNSYIPPTATFVFPDRLRYAPSYVEFDGTQSRDSSNNPVDKYFWEFDDGEVSIEARPRHAFKRPDTYNVKLTVTDIYGHTDLYSATVTISKFEPPAYFAVSKKGTWVPIFKAGYTKFTWSNPVQAPGERYDYQFTISFTRFLGIVECPFGNMSSLPQAREVAFFRDEYQWNADFCSGSTYMGRMRIKRTGSDIPGGSVWGPWSPEVEWKI